MKKLVIAVLAIGAMAACTKSNIQYEQPEEISFQPVAKKATKAVTGAIDGNDYPAGEDFNVWSWWTGEPAGTLISELADEFEFNVANIDPNKPILYINEGTFTNRKDANSNPTNKWGGKTTPYYWPTTGSLVFAGYSPADASTSGTFNYSFNTQTFTVEGYTQSSNISETVDLMWFDADKSYKQTDDVTPTFKHALSWLEFRFNLKDSNTPENWLIYSVTLKNINTEACFNSTDKWTLHANNADVEVYAENNGCELNYQTAAYNLNSNAQKGVIVIPQNCDSDLSNANAPSGVYLEISYGLLTPASLASGSNLYIPQTVTLPLTYTCNTDHDPRHDGENWEPGYHYIYTITFGANEILISPSVTEWAVENENIDVE